jgi:hypothetical protein
MTNCGGQLSFATASTWLKVVVVVVVVVVVFPSFVVVVVVVVVVVFPFFVVVGAGFK